MKNTARELKITPSVAALRRSSVEVQRLFRKLSAFSLELKNRVRPLLTLVALQCAASPTLGVKRASPPALGSTLPGSLKSC